MAGKMPKQEEAQAAAKKLTWQINIVSAVAVYVQIENLIKFALTAGKLKYKDQLPSVRELSERLEVNPNTVAKAYRDLEVMGLLYTQRGMGVFIEKTAEAQARNIVDKYLEQRIGEVGREAGTAGRDAGFTASQFRAQMKAGAAGEAIYT